MATETPGKAASAVPPRLRLGAATLCDTGGAAPPPPTPVRLACDRLLSAVAKGSGTAAASVGRFGDGLDALLRKESAVDLREVLSALRTEQKRQLWHRVHAALKAALRVLVSDDEFDTVAARRRADGAADLLLDCCKLVENALRCADAGDVQPKAFADCVRLLNGHILDVPSSESGAGAEVTRKLRAACSAIVTICCELRPQSGLQGNAQSQLYLLLQAHGGDVNPALVKRVHTHVHWAELVDGVAALKEQREGPERLDADFAVAALRRCFLVDAFWKCEEGRKFLAKQLAHDDIATLAALCTELLIDATVNGHKTARVRGQQLGDVLYRAWRAARAAERPAELEEEFVQRFMHMSVNRLAPFSDVCLHVVAAAFVKHKKKNEDVESMLHDLYQPILWSSFDVPNACVRLNAAKVLLTFYPFRRPGSKGAEAAQLDDKQFKLILNCVSDAETLPIRIASLEQLCTRLIPSLEHQLSVGQLKEFLKAAAACLRSDDLQLNIAVWTTFRSLLSVSRTREAVLSLVKKYAAAYARYRSAEIRYAVALILRDATKIVSVFDLLPKELLYEMVARDDVSDKVGRVACELLAPHVLDLGASRSQRVRSVMALATEAGVTAVRNVYAWLGAKDSRIAPALVAEHVTCMVRTAAALAGPAANAGDDADVKAESSADSTNSGSGDTDSTRASMTDLLADVDGGDAADGAAPLLDSAYKRELCAGALIDCSVILLVAKSKALLDDQRAGGRSLAKLHRGLSRMLPRCIDAFQQNAALTDSLYMLASCMPQEHVHAVCRATFKLIAQGGEPAKLSSGGGRPSECYLSRARAACLWDCDSVCKIVAEWIDSCVGAVGKKARYGGGGRKRQPDADQLCRLALDSLDALLRDSACRDALMAGGGGAMMEVAKCLAAFEPLVARYFAATDDFDECPPYELLERALRLRHTTLACVAVTPKDKEASADALARLAGTTSVWLSERLAPACAALYSTSPSGADALPPDDKRAQAVDYCRRWCGWLSDALTAGVYSRELATQIASAVRELADANECVPLAPAFGRLVVDALKATVYHEDHLLADATDSDSCGRFDLLVQPFAACAVALVIGANRYSAGYPDESRTGQSLVVSQLLCDLSKPVLDLADFVCTAAPQVDSVVSTRSMLLGRLLFLPLLALDDCLKQTVNDGYVMDARDADFRPPAFVEFVARQLLAKRPALCSELLHKLDEFCQGEIRAIIADRSATVLAATAQYLVLVTAKAGRADSTTSAAKPTASKVRRSLRALCRQVDAGEIDPAMAAAGLEAVQVADDTAASGTVGAGGEGRVVTLLTDAVRKMLV